MKQVRIGVLGGFRGTSMIEYCKSAPHAQVVAICDKAPEVLEKQKSKSEGLDIAFYESFDDFIKHDMDAVVLANYATEHAPFAIRCLKAGKHVYSEVLAFQTLQEAVELIEAVEETGKIYAYGENYCYMPAPWEMKCLYRQGKIGEFEYGECEYVHNCEPIWPNITYGDKDHWRNNTHCNYYCTHSLGPILHATGLRPVRVTGYEGKNTKRNERVGQKCGQFAIEMVELENGAMIKSLHGGLYMNSIWYSMYGSKGRMESAREDTEAGDVERIYIKADAFDGEYPKDQQIETYKPEVHKTEAEITGHAGSDAHAMWHFIEKILGNPEAEIIDVYEGVSMTICGHMAYLSVLSGGQPMDIPDLRNKEEREKYRNDVACCDPKVAGDQLLPCCSKGNPVIDDAVYEKVRQRWIETRDDY